MTRADLWTHRGPVNRGVSLITLHLHLNQPGKLGLESFTSWSGFRQVPGQAKDAARV